MTRRQGGSQVVEDTEKLHLQVRLAFDRMAES